MPICPVCRHDNPPTDRFCTGCGARMDLACAACGNTNAPTSRFCGQCGQPLASNTAQGVAPVAYTPKYLAERILTSRRTLEGERKQVTVLFADIKDSFGMLEGRDPEEARKLLDPALQAMIDAVHRYEGTVNQVLGDGIMAVFGAPLAHEDHAIRCCYAAMAMQAAVRRYTDQIRLSHGIEVRVRVGLNSGEVVVRAIANDLHMEYSAVGQTTHLAARMEQLAAPGSIRCTINTMRLAEGFVQATSLGEVPVKGLSDPVEVFEVIGVGVARTRMQALAARGLTRFVGRKRELQQLNRALTLARAGQGQLVALVGEPGVGKSRLVWEFTHSTRTSACLVLESSSVSYGKATPYLPIVDMLKSYFRIQDSDEPRDIREKVIGRLFALDDSLRSTLPAFLAILDVSSDDVEWAALDPAHRRKRTLDAVKRLLLRESQVQPLALVFEDLHWIDSETQLFLDAMVESLPISRVLLLVDYRPEYQHGWGGKTYYTQLRVDPLTPETADELLRGLLGPDATLIPLKRLLVEQTEGNPFFIEESVRTLVETHAMIGDRGNYRLARDVATIRVPATVQVVLASRIDRLQPAQKQLLQSAAVVGKDVPFSLLRAIVDDTDDALYQGLAELQAGEFLYEASLFPEAEYTFKHALTHEVAYDSLLKERRRGLHARIVDAIERLHADRLAEHAEKLAHHAMQGESWDQAVQYLRQAGRKAVARSAYREAARYYEEALEALPRLPNTPDRTSTAIDLRLELRVALGGLSEFTQNLANLRDAEELAHLLGDQRRLGWINAYLTNNYVLRGEVASAIGPGRTALAIADELNDIAMKTAAQYSLAMAHIYLGDYERAADMAEENLAHLTGERARERFGMTGLAAVLSRNVLARALAEQGRFAEAFAVGEESVRTAEAADHPYSRIIASNHLGYVRLRGGLLVDAVSVLERGRAVSEATGIWFAGLFATLGHAYAWSGRVDEGIAIIRDVISREDALGWLPRPVSYLALGEAYLAANRLDSALPIARQVVQQAADLNERPHHAYALRLLGEILRQGSPSEVDEARQAFEEASEIADHLKMKPLSAHCRLGLALLQPPRDRLAAIKVPLEALRGMGMTCWVSRVETEIG